MKPLKSFRGLDLTNVLAGPFCCHQLAHLGAEVIKIEVPGRGDLDRQLGAYPELNEKGMGVSFLAQNAGKRSLTLNLKHPEGREVFFRLVSKADVVVENFRPGVMERLGADYGQGSSRDWAAKGVRLAGVETIVAEGFERIHRTNLVGMGILPLEFKNGGTRESYAIDGTETFDVEGEITPRSEMTLMIHRSNGERIEVPVTCRLDTAEEVSIYAAGGVLQRFAQDFLLGNASAKGSVI